MRTISYVRINLLLIVAGFSTLADSHGLGSDFSDDIIAADLVFKGEVIDVDYRNSTPLSPRDPVLAHTFVTFRVDRVFTGRIASIEPSPREEPAPDPATLTLRFLGGAAGDDQYQLVYGTPLFDVGDVDVLMVSGNGEKICPLIRCLHGRYRVIERFMYGDDGQEIVQTSAASVRYGKFHRIRDIFVDQIGPTEVMRVGEVEIDETGVPRTLPDFGIHHDIDSFSHILEQEIAELKAAGVLPPKEPVPSQDISVAFSVDLAKPVQRLPVVEQEENPADTGVLVSDHIEQILLRLNDGDPVLDEREAAWLNRFRTRELQRLNRKELREAEKERRNDQARSVREQRAGLQ